MSPWELRALGRGGWHNLRWNQLSWVQTDSSTGPTEKEVTAEEVCWSERRLPRLRCRLLRCDLFWQPVTEMLLWHMAMAESKWKVYLVCEPCFGGLVQVDLHVFTQKGLVQVDLYVFTQKGLHTKRAEHEGWHFRWRFSSSPMEVACSLIAPGWRPSQILITQKWLIVGGVAWQTLAWVKLTWQTG